MGGTLEMAIIDPSENWDDPNCPYNATPPASHMERIQVYDTNETWDCSLGLSEATRSEEVKDSDDFDFDFQAQLNFGNAFNNCKHKTMTVYCPCPDKCSFLLCSKCCTVFCGQPCADGLKNNKSERADAKSCPLKASKPTASTSSAGTEEEKPERVMRKSVYEMAAVEDVPEKQQTPGPGSPVPAREQISHGYGQETTQLQSSLYQENKSESDPDPEDESYDETDPICNIVTTQDPNSPYIKGILLKKSGEAEDASNHNEVDQNKLAKHFRIVEGPPCSTPTLLKPGVKYSAACCWTGDPYDLGFNLFQEMEHVDYLCSIKLDDSWEKLENPRKGDVCMAPYLEEGETEPDTTWYRAKVLENSVELDDTSVLYVDFGNEARVAKKDLRIMPDELQKIPALAHRIKLNNVAPIKGQQGRKWSKEAKNELEELILQEHCEFVIEALVDGRGLVHTATVTHNGEDVGQALVKKGLAIDTTIPRETLKATRKRTTPASPGTPPPPVPTNKPGEGNISRNDVGLRMIPRGIASVPPNFYEQRKANAHGEGSVRASTSNEITPEQQPEVQNQGYSLILNSNSSVLKVNNNPPPRRGQETAADSVDAGVTSNLAPANHVNFQPKTENICSPRVVKSNARKLAPAERINALPLRTKLKVVISAVKDLNNFYLVNKVDIAKRRDMNQQLSTSADFSLLPYQPNIHPSRLVTVRSEKYNWVRGILVDTDNDQGIIRLIDYGEVLKVPMKGLKLPPKLAFEAPPYAYHCSMDILPSKTTVEGQAFGEEWDEWIVEKLRDLDADLNGKSLLARCIEAPQDGMSLVELKVPGREKTWGKELLAVGMAKCMFPEGTGRGTGIPIGSKSTSGEKSKAADG